jgi:hypothetical protein
MAVAGKLKPSVRDGLVQLYRGTNGPDRVSREGDGKTAHGSANAVERRAAGAEQAAQDKVERRDVDAGRQSARPLTLPL